VSGIPLYLQAWNSSVPHASSMRHMTKRSRWRQQYNAQTNSSNWKQSWKQHVDHKRRVDNFKMHNSVISTVYGLITELDYDRKPEEQLFGPTSNKRPIW
jgi:hypothetical protein